MSHTSSAAASGGSSKKASSVTGKTELIATRTHREGDWEIVETIRDRKPSRAYLFKGRRALRIEVAEKSCQQLTGYKLIEKDLRTVRTWVGLLRGELLKLGGVTAEGFLPQGERIYVLRALFVAVATTYAKVFTEARGRRISLSQAGWVPSECAETHHDLMKVRHEFTAHAGVGHETCVTVVAVDSAKGRRASPRVFVEMQQPAVPAREFLRNVDKLLDALHKRVLERIDKASERVIQDVLAGLDVAKIQRAKRNAEKRDRRSR